MNTNIMESNGYKSSKFLIFNRKFYDYAWNKNFPPLYGHTSIAYLKRCPGFNDAKQGDMRAALLVTGVSVKLQRIQELREKYPSAVLLPVMSNNKLPEALARTIGLKVCTGVREVQTLTRKNLSAMERLIHKPRFRGTVCKGESYIIVDDIVTQGGTVSALRQFILSKGGFVVAVVALAYSAGSGVIVPNTDRIHQLVEKFGYSRIVETLRSYHIANDLQEMTNSQISYLLRFKTMERIIKKIHKCLLKLFYRMLKIAEY